MIIGYRYWFSNNIANLNFMKSIFLPLWQRKGLAKPESPCTPMQNTAEKCAASNGSGY